MLSTGVTTLLSITALIIEGLYVTFSKMTLIITSLGHYAEYHCAECHVFFIMLSVVAPFMQPSYQRAVCWTSKPHLSSTTKCDQIHSNHFLWIQSHLKLEPSKSFCSTNWPQTYWKQDKFETINFKLAYHKPKNIMEMLQVCGKQYVA